MSSARAGTVRPGSWIGVPSGVKSPETIQVAPSRTRGIARARAAQPRSTGQGSRCQRSTVARVDRMPETKTYWFALTGHSSASVVRRLRALLGLQGEETRQGPAAAGD